MTDDWQRLLRFLRDSWKLPALELVRAPQRVAGGYGRRLWLLELLAPPWPQSRRFQLRCSDPGKASLALEVERLRWLAARAYPVSPPVLWVEDGAILGEPFALLEWVAGRTLAEQIRRAGWRPHGSEGRAVGLLLARLHALSPAGFPAEAAPGTLPPPLDDIADLAGPDRLDMLREWLDGHRAPPRSLAVCHLDLHPLNVVMSEDGPVVIDWEMARVDDPLLDVAMSQVHTEVALGVGEYPSLQDRLAYGRSALAAYRTLRPVPEADLRYCRVFAACRRLGDVAGALRRRNLGEEDRAGLQAEGVAVLGILDREIGYTGQKAIRG